MSPKSSVSPSVRHHVPPLAPPRSPSDRDELWWVAPAICTPLALVLGYFDYSGSFIGSAPAGWMVGYVVAFGLVVSSWLFGRTRRGRDWRIGLGVTGCVVAFFYGKTVSSLAIAVGIVLWLKNGD